MFDQSFNKKNLAGELKYGELPKPFPSMDKLLDESVKIAQAGFSGNLSLTFSQAKGKTVCKLSKLEEELVVRKASKNIQQLTNVKQSDRNIIVSNLVRILEEDVNYTVYRLDISNFYESIDCDELISEFRKDLGVSRHTLRIIESFFNSLKKKSVEGIPRGMAISAILSERVLRDFDNKMKQLNDVFFYSRYVDDIIVVSSGLEEKSIEKEAQLLLPKGLKINQNPEKKQVVPVLGSRPFGDQVCKINYLGYEFSVKNKESNKSLYRQVKLDIADNKINKIKTKCVLSCLDYIKNKDFPLLIQRIQLITSNYTIYKPSSKSKKLTGIYFNYKHLSDPDNSKLKDLDKFLRSLFLGGKTKISNHLFHLLSSKNKKRLLKYTFTNGFKKRAIYSYSPMDLKRIARVWKHE